MADILISLMKHDFLFAWTHCLLPNVHYETTQLVLVLVMMMVLLMWWICN